MAFEKIEARITPGARVGLPVNTSYTKEVAYDGSHLSVFYAKHGVPLKYMRAALRSAEIGSVFELEIGTAIAIPQF